MTLQAMGGNLECLDCCECGIAILEAIYRLWVELRQALGTAIPRIVIGWRIPGWPGHSLLPITFDLQIEIRVGFSFVGSLC